MTTLDPTPYILTAAIIGAGLGYMAACVYFCRRLRRNDRDSWRAARIYYRELYKHGSERGDG
jgi:hypothetical protein